MQHDTPHIVAIGPAHRLTFEPPDLVVLSWNGEVEPEHMRAFYDVLADVSGGRQLLVLLDMTRTIEPGSKTRKMAVEDPRTQLMGALALVNASFRMRVIVTMMDKAVSIFRGQTRRTTCFDDERAAREWLATQRPHLSRIDLASAS
ncbi:STAS/SEC14 domain-containing protein [Polyangium spumosum]|uniref:STAS/SEC14 domain-containing protein n=1 Tax=Polyangium spumosum TaxID=889282 RepID=A0A6N7PVY6_9BACT|nr:STAS/SEC14 domain-containing protein [Polyangium spumosum]MRG92971.1 hypothetical protein [Polyangium spumosum]